MTTSGLHSGIFGLASLTLGGGPWTTLGKKINLLFLFHVLLQMCVNASKAYFEACVSTLGMRFDSFLRRWTTWKCNPSKAKPLFSTFWAQGFTYVFDILFTSKSRTDLFQFLLLKLGWLWNSIWDLWAGWLKSFFQVYEKIRILVLSQSPARFICNTTGKKEGIGKHLEDTWEASVDLEHLWASRDSEILKVAQLSTKNAIVLRKW